MLGRRRRGARRAWPVDQSRHSQGKHPGQRPRRHRLHRPCRGHGPLQGALRPRHRNPHARRSHRGRRHLPRPLGARRADRRHGQEDGRAAADHGTRQPGTRDHARDRARGAARRDHRDRAVRLSQSGQQCPVFPVHLPRRARRRRDADQHRDEARLCARHRRRRDGRDVGRRRARLWRPEPVIRARLHPANAVRTHGSSSRSLPPSPRQRWTRASRRGRSTTSTPIARS